MHVYFIRQYGKPPWDDQTLLSRLSHLEAPTPLNRGDISSYFTDFSATNKALCALKTIEARDDSHFEITRQYG